MLLVVAASGYLAHALAFDAPGGFLRQKGELVGVEEEPAEGDALHRAYQVTLTSSAGYSVRGHLRVPRRQGHWPALVAMGGVLTGRRTAELIQLAEPIRRAMLLTPSAVLLAVDYLQRRPEVDSARVVLAGASFGALLMAVAGALDERASTVLLAYGGGDYAALLEGNLQRLPGWLRRPVARAGAWLVGPVEPLRYVAQVSPRRLIMINGPDDDWIPHHCVDVLYAAAREPKRLIWLEPGHVSSKDPESIERTVRAAAQALSVELAADPPGVE